MKSNGIGGGGGGGGAFSAYVPLTPGEYQKFRDLENRATKLTQDKLQTPGAVPALARVQQEKARVSLHQPQQQDNQEVDSLDDVELRRRRFNELTHLIHVLKKKVDDQQQQQQQQ